MAHEQEGGQGDRGTGGGGHNVPPSSRGEGAHTPASVLTEFAALLDEFAGAIEEELGLAGQRERQAVARVFRATMSQQTAGLKELFAEVLDKLPGDGKMVVERYFRVSGVAIAIDGARTALRDSSLSRRSVIEWIKFILELIKKIDAQLLKLLIDLFPKLEHLLTTIFNLIHPLDNILDGLNKLLVRAEPVSMEEVSRTMWQGLEVFWRAQSAFLSSPYAHLDTYSPE